MRLADKVAIVTGGAAGLGFAYARRFLAEGARVVVADVVDPAPAADTLGAAGPVLGVRIDVSDAGAARAMVEAAVARFGRVDVLVNNAAVFATLKPRAFDEIPEAEWDRVMAVNVTGIWNCVRAVAPVMRGQGGGRIVNVASAIVVQIDAIMRARSLKRDAFPEDVEGAVLFLASDDSAFMSGQTLVVDGGSVFSTL
jgi:NAD(P)-dependent dehydrogenase (short-subunit alcohol dehydrogenase family)